MYDCFGGIYILDVLVDFDGIELVLKYICFQNYIGSILCGCDINFMQLVVVVFGKLCKLGGFLIFELVDFEV